MQSLTAKLDKCPPFAVYAYAHRDHFKRPRRNDLAKKAGLPERTFSRITTKLTWARVKVADVDAFCKACDVDPLHPGEVFEFLQQSMSSEVPLAHLRPIQRAIFDQQCRKWQENLARRVPC
jgi:hypothetical protein